MNAVVESGRLEWLIDPMALQARADPTERALPCPVCRSALFAVLLTPAEVEAERAWLRELRRRGKRQPTGDKELIAYTQTKPTFIVRCADCGTLLREPQPTCEQVRALYADDSYDPAALDRTAANQDDFFHRKAEWVRPWLPAAAAVLEVGCFVGSFLRAAATLGWKAVGVDVGAQTSAYCRAAGLDVIQGDIQEADLPTTAWDGIFIWNTFDQVCDPVPVLARAFALLKTGGVLALRIPNGDFEHVCLQWRRRWRGDRRAEHVMRAQAYNSFMTFPYLTGYNPDSISWLLGRHGFTVVAIEGDTLAPLADDSTQPWAVREEARYKRAVSRLCRRFQESSGRIRHPWLNIIARKD